MRLKRRSRPRHGKKTSSNALKQIVAEGLLKKMQLEVAFYLGWHGPATAGEISAALKGSNRNNTARTLSILRDKDVVEECPTTKICEITGRKVILWRLTGRIPKKGPAPQKRRTRAELEKENRQLRAEIQRLKEQK